MTILNPQLVSVNVGKTEPLEGQGKTVSSAINKKPVQKELYLSKDQLQGDEQADKKNHGGEEKAICVYPQEHYSYWEDQLNCTLPPSAFGENITVKGLLETDTYIGDIFTWGDAIVQVCQPRIPCHKLEKRFGKEGIPQKVIETGFTGYYMRVLKEGKVSLDAPFVFKERTTNFSISFVNDVYHRDKDDIEKTKALVDTKELASGWRENMSRRLHKTSN
ncbi:MOSC domain-containing protein [Evansella cellulosilytica]|uniref:MOSC domain containing protein n=1 Tax=Evansella cellulosilytica (strain ATCC 21833 / DSM 2522 / FERM P-1141 / JCM 9156 / N-4) TaxID=649639 RepID=E6U053_EVAC2|nr:MOSC domain-containing protein [Evansella cellulosilytica]ADU29057.1 MOSC domain containing protein [Evansella cellulosilytica DSM 2522]